MREIRIIGYSIAALLVLVIAQYFFGFQSEDDIPVLVRWVWYTGGLMVGAYLIATQAS